MTEPGGSLAPATDPIPTLRGVEHVSMTVADLDQATAFFTDVFGCETLYTMGPFSGSGGAFMRVHANADVRTVVTHVRVLRSPFLNIELFAVESPVQRTRWPDMLDIGGWHLAGYVDDMDSAIDFLDGQGVYILGEGKKPTGGPEVGEGSYACHCMTDWGFHFELLTYPNGRAYQDSFDDRLWNPALPDRDAVASYRPTGGSLPTFRGFEHLSVTVADLDAATDLLAGVLGCQVFYDMDGPFNDRRDSRFGAYANTDVRASPSRVRLFRSPYLNVEVVECPEYPGQNRTWPGMLDVGGWHLAFYVDDVDAALEHLAQTDVLMLGGKKPAYQYESGDDAYTVHCVTRSGIYFELVTYPNGRYREDEFTGPAWHPAKPAL